jgi:hypothetical protein
VSSRSRQRQIESLAATRTDYAAGFAGSDASTAPALEPALPVFAALPPVPGFDMAEAFASLDTLASTALGVLVPQREWVGCRTRAHCGSA